MCTAVYTFSHLPLQGRKFRDEITKTAFRSYPSSTSSIYTQEISFLLRFSLWNRHRKILGGRKGLIKFRVTGKSSKVLGDWKGLIKFLVKGKASYVIG